MHMGAKDDEFNLDSARGNDDGGIFIGDNAIDL